MESFEKKVCIFFPAITHSASVSQCIPHTKLGGRELYSNVYGWVVFERINNYLLAVEVNERLKVLHVRLCCQCPGADVADVHVAAGHAAAPCGNGARSTSRLRTRLRSAAGAAPPSTALRVRSALSHPESCGGRCSGRVRFRCASRGAPWPAGFLTCSQCGR